MPLSCLHASVCVCFNFHLASIRLDDEIEKKNEHRNESMYKVYILFHNTPSFKPKVLLAGTHIARCLLEQCVECKQKLTNRTKHASKKEKSER